MSINTLVVKTEKIVSNSTTKCDPSKQEVCFSNQSGDPLTTVARSTKFIDIPGYNRSNTRIMRSLKTINNG